jgi:hypothetical protein
MDLPIYGFMTHEYVQCPPLGFVICDVYICVLYNVLYILNRRTSPYIVCTLYNMGEFHQQVLTNMGLPAVPDLAKDIFNVIIVLS